MGTLTCFRLLTKLYIPVGFSVNRVIPCRTVPLESNQVTSGSGCHLEPMAVSVPSLTEKVGLEYAGMVTGTHREQAEIGDPPCGLKYYERLVAWLCLNYSTN